MTTPQQFRCEDFADCPGVPDCCPGCHVEADMKYQSLRVVKGHNAEAHVCHPLVAWLAGPPVPGLWSAFLPAADEKAARD